MRNVAWVGTHRARTAGQGGKVALALLLAGCSIQATSPTAASPGASNPPGSTSRAGQVADVIFDDANVITMDDDNPRAQAVAIRGSTILAVGTSEDISGYQGPATTVVGLAGRTITPGFIDAHQHRIGDGPAALGLDSPGPLIDAAIAQGWTTIDELYVDEGRLDQLRSLDDAGVLRLRVNAYLPVQENSAEGRLLGDYFDAYTPGQMLSPHVRVAGLKVFTDFDNAKILLWTQDDLNAFLLQQHQKGWPLAVKTVSTRSLAMILTAFKAIDAVDPGLATARGRLEHLLFAAPDQIADIESLGLLPVINLNNPGQLVGLSDVDELIASEPPGSYTPWRSVFEAGIPAAGMSAFPSFYVDEPSGDPFGSPMHLVYQAVTRVGNLGRTSPAELLDQAIGVEDALRSITVNAARAAVEEDTKGSLTTGKLADLVVLSADPLGVGPGQINEIETLETLIGGRVEFCAPGSESLCPTASGPNASSPTEAATPVPSPPGALTATASQSLPDSPPSNALDGDDETIWSAGTDAEQWIQVDLGQPTDVTRIRLVTSQYPAGRTVHQVWVGESESSLRLVHTFDGPTDDRQELLYAPATPEAGVRIVRIVTTQSPSWVAWREVEISGD